MPGLRILVADDHELVRRGLRTLLETQPGWQVIAEAKDGSEAVKKCIELKPDIVILDIGMPRLNGLGAVNKIGKALPSAKVLILTIHDSDDLVREVVEAGARGYLTKSSAARDLISAVDALQKGKTYFMPRVDDFMLDSFRGAETNFGSIANAREFLTPRQREVIQLIAEGRSSKEVAVALGLSVKTAETHRANLMKRLGCHSVSELVRYAIRNHIIEA
jgi:DNA-binding NarL/FixJ family response regulator